MATSVGLNFRLTAAVDKFEASMRDVEKRLGGIEKASKDTASGMKLLAGIEVGKLLVSGLTSVVGIMQSGVSTVTQFASEAAAAADAMGKLSSMTGMAEEPLQVFTQLASYSGVSSTQFGDALQKMSRGLGEATNGTGTAAKGLEQLGLSVDELLSMSPSQQFLKIGQAIGEIEDPTRRSAVAADIFGRSGTKLIPMFQDLEVNAKATAAEMLQLGQVLSGTQVDNIEAMNDSFEKVRKTAFKIGSQVVANFAPAITEANASLIEMIKNFEYEGARGGQGLANFLTDALFTAARSIAKTLEVFINNFQTAVERMLKALASLLNGLSIGLAPLVGAQNTVGMQNAAMAIDHFADNVGFADVEITDLVDNAIASFKKSSTEAADSLGGLFAKTDATTETMQEWATNGLNANAAMKNLTSGIVNAAQVVPINLRELGAATQRAVYALDISGPAGVVKNALTALVNAPSAAAAGLTGLAGGFLEILAPLGFTKEKILELGQAAAAHSGFKQQLITTAMAEFDRVAQQKMQQYISAGANPFAVHAKMQEERNAYLARVNAEIQSKENAWIAATGGLTGNMEITAAQVQESGRVLGEKLSGAATTAAEWASGLATSAGNWLSNLFGGGEGDAGGEGAAGPNIPEPEKTLPELKKQSGTLDGILTAVQGFGANFVQATF